MTLSNETHFWQVLLAPIWFGVMFLIAASLPPFSPVVLCLGLMLTIAGSLAVFWRWRTQSWAASWVGANIVCLVFFFLTARGWSHVITVWWLWLVPLLGAYVIAWALPMLSPARSKQLYNEEVAPQSGPGRGCVITFLVLGSVAGTLGGSIGLYGSRAAGGGVAYWALAIIGSIVTIAFSHLIAQALWDNRPREARPSRAF